MKDMRRREISSEDLLKKAAAMVSKDLEKDLQEYENRAEALRMRKRLWTRIF